MAASAISSSRLLQPPGRFLQWINALLHKEPLSTLFHGIYWSLIIYMLSPVAVWVLLVRTFLCVTDQLKRFVLPNISSDYQKYDPTQHRDKELAVLVTGCDSGFGKEVVVWAAQAGYVVFAGCRDDKSLEQFRNLALVFPFHMDVTNEDHVQAAVSKVREWLLNKNSATQAESSNKNRQRIFHALVNNAGIAYFSDIDWMAMEDIQKTFDVNFWGVVRCCKAFLPLLKQQSIRRRYKGARILNVCSIAGLVPVIPYMGVYSASKFAIQAFSEALRVELKAWSIQVATINPTCHNTPLGDNVQEKIQHQWTKLSPFAREEYGQEYMEKSKVLGLKVTTLALWNMSVVVDQIVNHLLKRSQVPARNVVGCDGRFALVALRMLPDWIVEPIMLKLLTPRPAPASMSASPRIDE